MRTYTHTYYWSDDDLQALREEAANLRADYERRIVNNSFLQGDILESARDRIDNLDIAIRLMGDKAD